jgi:hypothetical protein
MRCYFLKNDVIRAIEVVRCASDESAIEHALLRFDMRKEEFTGFELWEGNRLVHQHPENMRRSA